MKIKQLTVVALSAIAMLAMTGCKDDLEIIVENPETTLSVASDAVYFEAGGGAKTVRVTSTADWTASSDANWLTVTKTSATVLTITAAENEDTEEREAAITVNADDKSCTIGISQAATVFSIEGEWFEDSSSESMKLFGTLQLNPDGTLKGWTAVANASTSLYGNYAGTYTYSGTSLTQKYNNAFTGENATDVYEVKKLDMYQLVIYLASLASTAEMHRIVDAYTLKVGQNKQMIVDDAKFSATEYISSDNAIASVDTQGNIVAQKRGTAYVSAKSAVGTAVVRVIVEDPENVIDNFFDFIGGSLDNVTMTYGSMFSDYSAGEVLQRRYFIVDEYVESIVVSYWANTAQAMEVYLRQNVDWDAIQGSFDNKYAKTNISSRYLAEKDGKTYQISLNKTLSTVSYALYTPPAAYSDADFEPYEGLVLLTLEEIAQKLNHTLTDEELEDGVFGVSLKNNSLFTTVSVTFDEEDENHEVGKISLRAKNNVTQDMFEPWYQDHYTATGDELNPYQSKTDPVYYVQFRQDKKGVFTVSYAKRKRKS